MKWWFWCWNWMCLDWVPIWESIVNLTGLKDKNMTSYNTISQAGDYKRQNGEDMKIHPVYHIPVLIDQHSYLLPYWIFTKISRRTSGETLTWMEPTGETTQANLFQRFTQFYTLYFSWQFFVFRKTWSCRDVPMRPGG